MIRLILRDNDISGIGLEAIGRLLAWQGKGGLGEAAFDAMLEVCTRAVQGMGGVLCSRVRVHE